MFTICFRSDREEQSRPSGTKETHFYLIMYGFGDDISKFLFFFHPHSTKKTYRLTLEVSDWSLILAQNMLISQRLSILLLFVVFIVLFVYSTDGINLNQTNITLAFSKKKKITSVTLCQPYDHGQGRVGDLGKQLQKKLPVLSLKYPVLKTKSFPIWNLLTMLFLLLISLFLPGLLLFFFLFLCHVKKQFCVLFFFSFLAALFCSSIFTPNSSSVHNAISSAHNFPSISLSPKLIQWKMPEILIPSFNNILTIT